MIFQSFAAIALLGVLALAIFRDPAPARNGLSDPPSSRSVFQETCATCHGNEGQGNKALMAPPISNLANWYVLEQLGKFRAGTRGSEPRDVHGQQMQGVVRALSDDQIAEAVAELITFPLLIPEHAHDANLAEGREAYREHCMECHRYNGHGEMAFKSASLAGLPDWYLAAQMEKYRQGIRGYHPDDETGAKMRAMTLRPESEKQLRDIIAYITTLSKEYPVEKLKKGARRDSLSPRE